MVAFTMTKIRRPLFGPPIITATTVADLAFLQL